jgi:hypothetical protein
VEHQVQNGNRPYSTTSSNAVDLVVENKRNNYTFRGDGNKDWIFNNLVRLLALLRNVRALYLKLDRRVDNAGQVLGKRATTHTVELWDCSSGPLNKQQRITDKPIDIVTGTDRVVHKRIEQHVQAQYKTGVCQNPMTWLSTELFMYLLDSLWLEMHLPGKYAECVNLFSGCSWPNGFLEGNTDNYHLYGRRFM